MIYPSPQTSTQVLAVKPLPPVQLHPFTLPVQELLHLSAFEVSPSSQYSLPSFLPSPQIGVHVLIVIAPLLVHVHPVSIVQVELQPSPLAVF